MSSSTLAPTPHDPDVMTSNALQYYQEIIACIPMPVCLLNRKGFICYANEDFHELIQISVSTDFPYIGRYLDHKSASKIRILLDKNHDLDEKKPIYTFNCVWNDSCIRNDMANRMLSWTLSGKASNSVFLLCGRYLIFVQNDVLIVDSQCERIYRIEKRHNRSSGFGGGTSQRRNFKCSQTPHCHADQEYSRSHYADF